MSRILRPMLYLAAAFAFVMAVLPHPPQPPGAPSDKVQHILAFVTLGGLAALSYPAASMARLVVALALFGATVELVQSIPALNRDADVVDFAVDVIAALVAVWATRRIKGRFDRGGGEHE